MHKKTLHLSFSLTAVRQSVPRFLQNQRLCRDLRKQTSECWQLQDQCQLCQGALLSGEAPAPPEHLSSHLLT